MEWQKLTTSGSNAHLEALHLLGATSSVAEVSNSVYYPDEQYFRLHNFGGPEGFENTSWTTNNINSNASGGSWISTVRTINGVTHRRFDVSGYNPSGYNLQNNTGPASGITPTFAELNTGLASTGYAIDQTPDTLYLYTETSDGGENTYSITSPLINLTDYSNTKLVFYFYLFGQNAGNFKVFTSTSNSSLLPSTDNAIQQDIRPVMLNEQFNLYFISDPVSQVGYQGDNIPNQNTHTDNSSEWYRAEADLTSFTEGYIWIVYESGGPGVIQQFNPDQADFAISNVFLANSNNTTLDSDSYTVPETEEIDNYELSLKVLGDVIKLYGLPESDPEEEGQLYQDPDFIDANQGFILISNGPI